jgi:hypothetical protein
VTITGRAAVAAAIALALAISAGAADARANNWTTMIKVNRGKVQACKVATTKTGPWKVKLRVDARSATTAVLGSAYADKDGQALAAQWDTDWIDPGSVSAVGTLRVPRGSAYHLDAQLESEGAGSGSSSPMSSVSRC